MTSGMFNFRHVCDICGVPPSNENHWAVGHILRQVAAEHGVEPQRILTAKTDPSPTVAAPHCIAHYPVEIFAAVCNRVSAEWRDRAKQMTMDFDL